MFIPYHKLLIVFIHCLLLCLKPKIFGLWDRGHLSDLYDIANKEWFVTVPEATLTLRRRPTTDENTRSSWTFCLQPIPPMLIIYIPSRSEGISRSRSLQLHTDQTSTDRCCSIEHSLLSRLTWSGTLPEALVIEA